MTEIQAPQPEQRPQFWCAAMIDREGTPFYFSRIQKHRNVAEAARDAWAKDVGADRVAALPVFIGAPAIPAPEGGDEQATFEAELRRQCFQAPPTEARDLAWSMWMARAALASQPAPAPAEGALNEREAFASQEFGAKMADSSRAHFLQTGEPPYYLHDAWVAWQARAALASKVQPKGLSDDEREELAFSHTNIEKGALERYWYRKGLKDMRESAATQAPAVGAGDGAANQAGEAVLTCRACGSAAIRGPLGEFPSCRCGNSSFNGVFYAGSQRAPDCGKPLQGCIDDLIGKHGSLRAVARECALDPGYLSCLHRGEKDNPSDATLEALGLRRHVLYTPVQGSQP